MAITDTQTQVTWSSASTLTVTSATEVVSDVMTIDASCINLSFSLYSTVSTTGSGDTAVWRIRWSTGDVKNDSGDDYDTAEHAAVIAVLDCYPTNTPGENPAQLTVPVPRGASKYKLACTCAGAATHNMTIAARMNEQRAA